MSSPEEAPPSQCDKALTKLGAESKLEKKVFKYLVAPLICGLFLVVISSMCMLMLEVPTWLAIAERKSETLEKDAVLTVAKLRASFAKEV